MMRFVLATANPDKAREIHGGAGCVGRSGRAAGLTRPSPTSTKTGLTLEEDAA